VSSLSELHILRMRRRRAHLAILDTKKELDEARKACIDFIEEHPPKSFRLQEAYRNPDGTYAEPHWNEVFAFQGQNAIDQDELIEHIIQAGEWTLVYEDETTDPRPGCRRVTEVQWELETPPLYATEVNLSIGAINGPDIDLNVTLKACPDYELGAYYVGRIIVGGKRFKVKAICVQSTAGGRGWVAWGEKLEKKLEVLSVGDSNRRAVELDITPPGATERVQGQYIVCIHPLSESDEE